MCINEYLHAGRVIVIHFNTEAEILADMFHPENTVTVKSNTFGVCPKGVLDGIFNSKTFPRIGR